jgi:DNA-binding NarL/FixJ family response regulator
MFHAKVEVFEVVVAGERLVVVSVPAGTEQHRLEHLLSRAELEVALDAAAGLTNQAIAARRRRAVRTVANQLASVYRKLGINSRAELAARLFAK